jgi:hypothetical protein
MVSRLAGVLEAVGGLLIVTAAFLITVPAGVAVLGLFVAASGWAAERTGG